MDFTNSVNSNIARVWGLGAVNFAASSACASAMDAQIEAYDKIRLGKADVILTGGSADDTTGLVNSSYANTRGALTKETDNRLAPKCWGYQRDGFVQGEGAVVLVFEEYEHALARGARIYAWVIGSGQTCDAFDLTNPNPAGQYRAMRLAVEEAGIKPGDIDFIATHTTGTENGDGEELEAILRLYKAFEQEDAAYKVPLNASKSNAGHLLAASAGLTTAVALLAISEGIIPKTLNLGNIDPPLSKYNLVTETTHKPVNAAMANAFGFGGHNAVLVLSKYQ